MTFNLQEDCQALQQDVSQYPVSNDHDVQSMDQASIVDLLDGAYTLHGVHARVNDFFRCNRGYRSIIGRDYRCRSF